MINKIKNPWLDKPGYNCICCSPNNPLEEDGVAKALRHFGLIQ